MNSVLLISNFLSSWGSRSVCEELAVRLEGSGLRVITASDKRSRIPRLLDMLQTAWLRRNEYDVAHVAVFSGPAFLWAEATCLLLRAIRKPYALTLHGGNLPLFAASHPKRVQSLLRSAAVVFAPSNYLQAAMSTYRSDIYLVENGLDLHRYPFRLRRCPQPNLVWLRAFHHIYNPILAIKVLRRVVDAYPNGRLLMVGPDKNDGSKQAAVQAAEKLRVADRVQFVGAVKKDEVPVWLNRGDIFLNTTNVDNTPVSVIEALACGLCVVSTNVGGIPFLLENNKNALIVPPDDAEAMADGVYRILGASKTAETLSENGHALVKKFDWSFILPKWMQWVCHAETQRAAAEVAA